MDIISLLEELVNSLIEAEDKFLKNPKDFHSLEKATKASLVLQLLSKNQFIKSTNHKPLG